MLLIVAIFALTGCGTTLTSPNVHLIAKASIQLGVLEYADRNPEKAAKIAEVAGAIRAIAGGEGYNTVDLLIAAVKAKANIANLPPERQVLANLLIELIAEPLRQKVGNAQLSSGNLLVVSEVLGWVEDAARSSRPAA